MSDLPTPVDTRDAEGRIDEELLAFVRLQMSELQVPGVALGVAHGERVAATGLGITSLANPLPVDADTLFQVASITKTMTATAVMALVEQGRVDLDDPVRRHLPDFAVADEEVSERTTLRDLLTHTGGWEGDVFEHTSWGDEAMDALVRRMRKLRQVTPFRTLSSYNNIGFAVLGRILEVLHDEPYDALMRRVLFAPLGMKRARFRAHDVMLERFVAGHSVGPQGLQVARPWAQPRSTDAVGGTISSVRELLRYARFHLGTLVPDAPPIGDETRQLMQRPGAPDALNGDAMGITWMLSSVGGVRVVGHGGGAHGQPCQLALHPEHGLAVAVLTNREDDEHRLARRTIRFVQERYLGAAEPVPQPRPDAFGDLDAVTGVYETYIERHRVRRIGNELRVDTERTRDWLDDMDPPFPDAPDQRFIPIGPDTVAEAPLDEGTRATFYRDDAGAIRWLHLRGRAALRTADGDDQQVDSVV